MPGLLCYKAVDNVDVSVQSAAGGVADSEHPIENVSDGREDTYFRYADNGSLSSITIRQEVTAADRIGLGVLSAIGVVAEYSGSPFPPLDLLVRLRVGTTAGGTEIFEGHKKLFGPLVAGDTERIYMPANVHFVISDFSTEDEIDGGGIRGYGSNPVYADWRFSSAGGTPFNISIRSLYGWSGLIGSIKATRVLACNDLSDVQRAYSGAEFVNKKKPKRVYSAAFTSLDDKQVFGGTRAAVTSDSSGEVTANISNINSSTGASNPVLFIPHSDLGTSGYTTIVSPETGRDYNTDIIAQSEMIYGFLSQPLQAREIALLGGGGSFWEADFTITEKFNGIS